MADSRKRSTGTQPGGTIRFEEPSRKHGRNTNKTVLVTEIIPGRGFLNFLREHTVVSLAVGFAIATQAQTVIKQLISSFIDPLYGLLFSQKLSARAVTLHFHDRAQVFTWGAFVYTFIDFMFVLLAIYIVIKAFSLDKLDIVKKTEEE
jgi:large conductance mechanosensitive channel protein